MSIYDKYVQKKVKIVWKDINSQKAVTGIFIDYIEPFLTLKADKYDNLISINSNSIISIIEFMGDKYE